MSILCYEIESHHFAWVKVVWNIHHENKHEHGLYEQNFIVVFLMKVIENTHLNLTSVNA